MVLLAEKQDGFTAATKTVLLNNPRPISLYDEVTALE